MDARLRYTRDELLSSHPYARPHEAAGYRLHGGFVEGGGYVSPRTLVRWPAIRAWGEALERRGWPLIDASGRLLEREGYPTFEQHRLLLKAGLGQALWNSLTITGIIEARGRALCDIPAPNLQAIVVEPIADTACGHLGGGLFFAHGADEGGDPGAPGVGAHDQMWFAARDLVFGKNRYPLVEPPGSISREVVGREMPQIPEPLEQLLRMLMNVLMIEIRAESFFSLCCRLFRDPELFTDRRDDAELAATMVERIQADEASHVGYLQVAISEMRAFTWRTPQGPVAGKDMLDPVWARMVEWHGRIERDLAAQRSRAEIGRQVVAAKGETEGRRLLDQLDALDPAGAPQPA
ncbi:MAG TPA: hypothetical protein VG248_00985 [Caulobacteraceae bacterium]|jgi:hypothetical protein|nr:hypothetical protein [Caulobacteraceae bacterium]